MAQPGSSPNKPASNNPNGYEVSTLIPYTKSTSNLAIGAERSINLRTETRLLGVFGDTFKKTHYNGDTKVLEDSLAFPSTKRVLEMYRETVKASMLLIKDAMWNLADFSGAVEHKFCGERFQVNSTTFALESSVGLINTGFVSINSQQFIVLSHYENRVVDNSYNQHQQYWLRAEMGLHFIGGTLVEHALGGIERQTSALNDVALTRLQYSDVYVNQVGTQDVVPQGGKKAPNAGTCLNISTGPYVISSRRSISIDAPRVMINSGRAPKSGPAVKRLSQMPNFPKSAIVPTQRPKVTNIEGANFTVPLGGTDRQPAIPPNSAFLSQIESMFENLE